MAVVIIFCLMFLFLPLAKQSATQDALAYVMDAVEMIIEFYQKDYRNLNVDGLYGLRVLEGHLDGILQKHVAGNLNHVTISVISRVKSMKEKATRVCNKATEDVKKDDLRYFQQMSYVVGSPWEVFDTVRRKVNISIPWDKHIYSYAKLHVKVNEEISDECMSQLIGSHKRGGKTCDIGRQCAKTMTAPGLIGYGITHQILWTMLAEKAGCRAILEQKLEESSRGTLTALRLELCSNNYVQLANTLKRLKNMTILSYLQDLFLEELFICPSLGYYEFLSLDFLPQILSWQHQSGCYGESNLRTKQGAVKSNTPDNFDDGFGAVNLKTIIAGVKLGTNNINKLSNKSKFDDSHHGGRKLLSGELWDTPSHQGRRLLVEKVMSDGCLAHKTAVASGALIMYLRFLLEPDAHVIFNKTFTGKHPTNMDFKMSVQQKTKNGGTSIKAHDTNSNFNKDHIGDRNKALNNENRQSDKNIMQNKLLDRHEAKLEKIEEVDNVLSKKQRRDTAKVQHDNHQLQPPDFHRNEKEIPVAYDNNQLAVNNNNLHLNHNVIEKKPEVGDKDDQNYNYKYEHGAGNNDDDDEDDDDDAGYDYLKRGDKNDIKDDDYYDNENQDLKKADQHANAGIGHLMDDNNEDDYNKAGDEYNDDEEEDEDEEDAEEDEDKAADYGDKDYKNHDKDTENLHGHPHINARNIGKGNHEYENEGEKSLNHVREYKYDDEEEDDYEYDDDNDMMEKKKEDEVKEDEAFLDAAIHLDKDKLSALRQSAHLNNEKVPSSSAFFIFAICIVLVLLFVYRFIKKRRIRIRLNPKHFHV